MATSYAAQLATAKEIHAKLLTTVDSHSQGGAVTLAIRRRKLKELQDTIEWLEDQVAKESVSGNRRQAVRVHAAHD